MVATAHLDRKGRGVAHSVASSQGGHEPGDNPDSVSEGRETVFITKDPKLTNGKVEIVNG
jgi:hypothetical protein